MATTQAQQTSLPFSIKVQLTWASGHQKEVVYRHFLPTRTSGTRFRESARLSHDAGMPVLQTTGLPHLALGQEYRDIAAAEITGMRCDE